MDMYQGANSMESHKKMYAILCGAISDALDRMPHLSENIEVRFLLEKALSEVEELCLDNLDAPYGSL